MLAIRNLNVHYGGIHALRGIDIDVPDGKIISLIGANGAGKSTTLKSVMGLVPKSDGHVYWDNTEITSLKTKDIVGEGIILCPEGRRIFPDLTVDENIAAGAYLRKDKAEIARDRDWVYELFPRIGVPLDLVEKSEQRVGPMIKDDDFWRIDSYGETRRASLGRVVAPYFI